MAETVESQPEGPSPQQDDKRARDVSPMGSSQEGSCKRSRTRSSHDDDDRSASEAQGSNEFVLDEFDIAWARGADPEQLFMEGDVAIPELPHSPELCAPGCAAPPEERPQLQVLAADNEGESVEATVRGGWDMSASSCWGVAASLSGWLSSLMSTSCAAATAASSAGRPTAVR